MRRLRVGVVFTALFALSVSACFESKSKEITERGFDPANFSDGSTTVDNAWFPLAPGTQLTFEGQANRGAGIAAHRVVFTVSDLTKVIDGIDTVVIWEQDINEGQLLESELAFHAQDDDGNVWHFGEYPEIYEQGKLVGAEDTWIVGQARAEPGILMRAEPRVGSSSYLQGWAPAVEFRDRAKEFKSGQQNCVPVRCFDNVLVTDEWSPLAPGDGHQLKFYGRGVGTIRVEPGRGSPEQETLVLVENKKLDPKELAEVRKQVLELDNRAYDVSEALYSKTPRAKYTPPAQQSQ